MNNKSSKNRANLANPEPQTLDERSGDPVVGLAKSATRNLVISDGQFPKEGGPLKTGFAV